MESTPFTVMLDLVPVNKTCGTRCEYQLKGGCRVYERRPLPCQIYSCLWRRGWGQSSDRPDRCEVIVDDAVDVEAIMLIAEVQGSIPVVMVSEVHADVFPARDAPISDFPVQVQRLARERVVLIRRWGEQQPERVRGLQEHVDRFKVVDAEWCRRRGVEPRWQRG